MISIINSISGNCLKRYSLFFLFVIFLFSVNSQAYFTAKDTICIDDSVVITNLSRDATSYYWNFCSGNLSYIPGGENLSNSGKLSEPAFIDFAKQNDEFYAFITNHNNATITRNYYGSDFLEDPQSDVLNVLGGIITDKHLQGIQVLYDNDSDSWYVFVVGGQREDSKLVRLNFGNSLSLTPTVINLGNLNNLLDTPIDLFITLENSNWIGFTVNQNTNTVTRFDFGASLSNNSPGAVNLNISSNFLNTPCGILPIKENGNWYMFISNYRGHDISRLDFGSDLLNNNPAGESIGNSAFLYYPFDLTVLRDCEHLYGFVVNRYNDIVRLDFNDGLDNIPEFTSLGKIGNLYNPQGISDVFRVGDSLYAFVANIDNSTITRLNFPGCTNASPSSSELRDPPAVRYNEAGQYNINLTIDEGLPQQENYCIDIVVLASPEVSLGNDTLIPAGSVIQLSPDTTYSTYLWSTGSTEPSIEVDEAGIYSLTITNEYGCKSTDEIEVTMDIGIPNFFTPNADGYNDTWQIPFLDSEPDAEIWIYDRFGNLIISYKAGEDEWNGTLNSKLLPVGTYWYIIKAPGIKKPYKGPVTIKY